MIGYKFGTQVTIRAGTRGCDAVDAGAVTAALRAGAM